MTYIGEIAALASAGSWAIASTIFSVSVKAYTPIMLNFVKGLVSVLILFTMMVLFNDELFPSNAESYMYYKLLLSGTIGIAAGDTFYFYALEELGARSTILLETLAPPFTGVIAFIYYGNTISLTGWIGIGFTVSGIALVVREQTAENQSQKDTEMLLISANEPLTETSQCSIDEYLEKMKIARQKQIIGYFAGALSMFCQALGIVVSHDVLKTQIFGPSTSSFVRLVGGSIALALVITLKKQESFTIPKQSNKLNALLGLGILCGPVSCIWCQQLSVTYTRPEIGQTLMATTPIFAIFIGKIQGHTIGIKYIQGSLLAILGVVLTVWK